MVDRRLAVPRLIGIVGLPSRSTGSDGAVHNLQPTLIRKVLVERAELDTRAQVQSANVSNIYVKQFNQRLTLYESPVDIFSMIDLAKVSDIMLLVISANHGSGPFEGVEFTDDSKLVLSCLRANGLPSVILVVQVGLISFSDFNFRMRALVNRSLGFRDYPTKKEEAC